MRARNQNAPNRLQDSFSLTQKHSTIDAWKIKRNLCASWLQNLVHLTFCTHWLRSREISSSPPQFPLGNCAVLYRTGSKHLPLQKLKTGGRNVDIDQKIPSFLSMYWVDSVQQIKKICLIRFNMMINTAVLYRDFQHWEKPYIHMHMQDWNG